MTTNWTDENRALFTALKEEQAVTFIVIALIVMVAALNILIALTMMVMEKTRDIAVLTSFGVQPAQIRGIFLLQGLLITSLAYLLLLLWESRPGILAAVIAGFGRVLGEVGASMMVGGNIRGYTRVLTTATVLEVSKGEFKLAAALSIILLLLSFFIMAALSYLQQRGTQQ